MKHPTFVGLALLATSVVACSSVPIEVMHGETDCYEFNALGADVGENTFTASGIQAKAHPACPKISSVHIDVFDDANGNGILDAGETSFSQADGQANPPTQCLTTASMSGGKNTSRGGTTWHATVVNEDGGVTSHGGTF